MIDYTQKVLLAIDSSSVDLRLAVQYGGDRLIKSSETVERSHGVVLFKKIGELLSSASLQPSMIDAIVVATGPGSFTGLRIGLAAAKGMAIARSLPIVGVSLLDLADRLLATKEEGHLLLLPFKRDRLFALPQKNGRYDATFAEALSIERVRQMADRISLVSIGRPPVQEYEALDGIPIENIAFDASDLIAIGMQRLQSDDIDELASLEPLYLQKSQAEIAFDKRQQDSN
jgi:tRNA threonylcarbamoyladenosine biosynthesis protein TsaB